MGDIEDGAFGKLVDWLVETFLWVMTLFGAFRDKDEKGKEKGKK